MIEIFGLVFGGISRLAQHWMDLKEKDRERSHEAVMFDKQIAMADKRFDHDAALRKLDAESADSAAEWQALQTAIDAQAREAAAAGGWVAALSASVRPVLSYWFAVIYTIAKFAAFYMALHAGVEFGTAVKALYTEFDGAVFASVVSFYFADRALRRKFA